MTTSRTSAEIWCKERFGRDFIDRMIVYAPYLPLYQTCFPLQQEFEFVKDFNVPRERQTTFGFYHDTFGFEPIGD